MLDMIVLGTEKAVRRLANVIRPILMNSLVILVGGSMSMSVMSIRNNVNNFVKIPVAGITGSIALMSGLFYREVSKDHVYELGIIAHRFTYIFFASLITVIFVLAHPIAVFSWELTVKHCLS